MNTMLLGDFNVRDMYVFDFKRLTASPKFAIVSWVSLAPIQSLMNRLLILGFMLTPKLGGFPCEEPSVIFMYF